MTESSVWLPIVLGALFALVALGFSALAVPNHPDRKQAAKLFFSLAAIVWGITTFVWAISTTHGGWLRFVVCFVCFGLIGSGLVEGFRFANSAAEQTEQPVQPALEPVATEPPSTAPQQQPASAEKKEVRPGKSHPKNLRSKSAPPDDGEDILLGRKKPKIH